MPLTAYFERLQRSFAAVYAYLEIPRATRRAVVALLAVHTMLLGYSAYVHSPTLNEPAHLVAGLSIWRFGRFDVYSVNPPLVKMVAALPVMVAGYEEDWSGFYTGPGARPEFAMGEDFVAVNGERSFYLFMIARWGCIPFSWLGAIVCYLWARDLFGRPSGVVACAMWCFEPNILAHASLITPDAHATALGVASCYTFWRWLKRPTWSQAALTGVVLGLAELAKTTLILFYPLWPLMWVIYRWVDRQPMRARECVREGGMLVLRLVVGLYVLNLGYCFKGSLTPLGRYYFVSDLFAGTPSTGTTTGRELKHLAFETITSTSHFNRFTNSWLANLPVPFPADYIAGVDLQQNDFEHSGRRSFLAGKWENHGWWYYYIYAATIKIPLGLWAACIFGLLTNISFPPKTACLKGDVVRRDVFVLVLPPLIILSVASSKTGFSEHFRYVLPCIPFAVVAISGQLKALGSNSRVQQVAQSGPQSVFPSIAIWSGLLVWFASSSAWAYPHSLSYFNEAIGGPRNGPLYLQGSNVDWGQDFRYLDWWLAHGHREHLSSSAAVAYRGGFSPASFYRANYSFASLSCIEYLAISESHVAAGLNSVNNLWPPEVATRLSGDKAFLNLPTLWRLTYSLRILGLPESQP